MQPNHPLGSTIGDTIPPSEYKDTTVGMQSKTKTKKEPQESSEDHYCEMNMLVRIHKLPRHGLFEPTNWVRPDADPG